MISQEKVKQAIKNCNKEQFKFRDVDFCGEDAVFVNPDLKGADWNQQNKYLRSLIYRKKDYKVLSTGFEKFTNWGENPDNFPTPVDLIGAKCVSKEDGSSMILDYINGQINIRVRDTITYKILKNDFEFEFILDKYPLIKPWIKNQENLSLIFEIVTPNHKIILDYPQIDVFLIGAVDKNTLNRKSQQELDFFAKEMRVPRPKTYHFNSINGMIEFIKHSRGIEGCCVYKDGGIWKVKSDEYLKRHSFKFNATPKNILELFESQSFPNFDDFKQYILDTFDFECWQMVEDLVTQICVYKKEVDAEIKGIQKFVNNNKGLTDKEFAALIADMQIKSIAFSLRKGKELPSKVIKNKIKEKLC